MKNKITNKKMCDKLFFPLKDNNGTLEFIFDRRGKIKSYKSTTSLLTYAEDYDSIAIYTLSSIQPRNENV